jgi:hypothetical protein
MCVFSPKEIYSSCTECSVILFLYIVLSYVHVLLYREASFPDCYT